MYEVAADIQEELVEKAIARFNVDLSRESQSCGFRHHSFVYVAELIRGRTTDKLDYLEVEFTLHIYLLNTKKKEKVKVTPKLPNEARVRSFTLPKRELVVKLSFMQEF